MKRGFNRNSVFVLLFMFILSGSLLMSADTKIVRVKKNQVNVRAQASVSSAKISTVKRNVVLKSPEKSGRWFKVVLLNKETGFIREDMVEDVSSLIKPEDFTGRYRLQTIFNVINIRNKPDKSGAVIVKVRKGTELKASEKTGQWYKVILQRLAGDKLVDAYVKDTTVKLIEEIKIPEPVKKEEQKTVVEKDVKKEVAEEKKPEQVVEKKVIKKEVPVQVKTEEKKEEPVTEEEPAVKKFFVELSANMLFLSDSDYKDMYKSSVFIPQLTSGYYITENVYVFGGFEFYKAEGQTQVLKFDIDMDQKIFSLGAGYTKNLDKKFCLSGEVSVLFLKYKESLDTLGLERDENCTGFRLGVKSMYKVSPCLGIVFKLGYTSLKHTNNDIESNFSGINTGIGICLKL